MTTIWRASRATPPSIARTSGAISPSRWEASRAAASPSPMSRGAGRVGSTAAPDAAMPRVEHDVAHDAGRAPAVEHRVPRPAQHPRPREQVGVDRRAEPSTRHREPPLPPPRSLARAAVAERVRLRFRDWWVGVGRSRNRTSVCAPTAALLQRPRGVDRPRRRPYVGLAGDPRGAPCAVETQESEERATRWPLISP